MTKVTLLDVGHGNCALICDNDDIVVVDSPTGSILLDTLEDLGIDTISAAIISHSDKDHISGVLSLLTSDKVTVGKIYVNPDSPRRTKTWKDFLTAVRIAERKGKCQIVTSLSSTTPGDIQVGEANIKVVAPSASLALTGVGGVTQDGKKVTSNTLSSVLCIEGQEGKGLLLAGDLDEVGLDDAIENEAILSAEALVFPHHGGLPGGANPNSFAARLLDQVKPNLVVFSNGRGRHDNPRPEIIGAVHRKGCAIACTQLSERCHPGAINSNSHLEPLRAHGRDTGASCAGSVTILVEQHAIRLPGTTESHQKFVDDEISQPMCRVGVPVT